MSFLESTSWLSCPDSALPEIKEGCLDEEKQKIDLKKKEEFEIKTTGPLEDFFGVDLGLGI